MKKVNEENKWSYSWGPKDRNWPMILAVASFFIMGAYYKINSIMWTAFVWGIAWFVLINQKDNREYVKTKGEVVRVSKSEYDKATGK